MNATLRRIFGKDWKHVRSTVTDGKELHMAYDICKILGLKNVTLAIRSAKGACNVKSEHRTMELIEDWNKFRTVHLLSIEGVFELILNNKSAECRRIKDYIVMSIMPEVIFKFRYQSEITESMYGDDHEK
jgi:prophage antirepressor-like protein